MSHLFPDQVDRDEYHGLYWEEVGKLVDGVEADILSGFLASQEQAERQLEEHVGASEWVTDNEHWAIHTLLWSKHACESIIQGNVPGMTFRGIQSSQNYKDGDQFPFKWFAEDAMKADCKEKLSQVEAFKNLPEQDPDDDVQGD